MSDEADDRHSPEDAVSDDDPAREHPPMLVVLQRFAETIDALRELQDSIAPHVAELDSKRTGPETLAALRTLPPGRRQLLTQFIEASHRKADEGSKTALPPAEDAAPSVTADPGPEPDPPDRSGTELSEESRVTLDEVFGSVNSVAFMEFQLILLKASLAPQRATILRNSLLATGVSAFEVLIAGTIAQYFVKNPGALGDEPEFTVEDLRRFATIEDAEDESISNRVEDILRGGFDSWTKWLEKNPKLIVKNWCDDYGALSEIFQRRHIILHNGGHVSRRYLERVTFRNEAPDLGARLPATESYLRNALDELDAIGNLIAIGMWAKLEPEDKSAALTFLQFRSYELLKAGRWNAVVQICAVGKKIDSTQALQNLFQVNEWVATKRMKGREAVEEAARAWDTSALQKRFELAKCALLDDTDAALQLADHLLEHDDQMMLRDAEEWPVLEELRRDQRFIEIIERHRQRDPTRP